VPDARPYCTDRFPLIYPFVQSHYWDVGFLRYWRLQQVGLARVYGVKFDCLVTTDCLVVMTCNVLQIPQFFLAGPALLAGLASIVHFAYSAPLWTLTRHPLVPHVATTALLTIACLFSMHVQARTRQSACNYYFFY
jgi:hypothetical protein